MRCKLERPKIMGKSAALMVVIEDAENRLVPAAGGVALARGLEHIRLIYLHKIFSM